MNFLRRDYQREYSAGSVRGECVSRPPGEEAPVSGAAPGRRGPEGKTIQGGISAAERLAVLRR